MMMMMVIIIIIINNNNHNNHNNNISGNLFSPTPEFRGILPTPPITPGTPRTCLSCT